ncbi:glycerophosphodiester phosphodiesterase family protein [Sinomicrobium oceani]|uniref:glycerophosphodiester phosphodiesterase family protein n=1 Tax=Sinomicrobium oceani TaxID=1150368 RepID=UPI00227C6B49|nr:glycerophosphodiester phosphodiesterase family protein [Sinomicrobium oceani]
MRFRLSVWHKVLPYFLFCGLTFAQQESNFDLAKKHLETLSPNLVLVAAHRGPHKQLPENSLASIEKAIESGIDIVEIDVRVSKDGVPVIMHDNNIKRTTTGEGVVEKMTLEELKKVFLLDAEKQVTQERIPTLKEVLDLARNRVFLDLDMKVNRRGQQRTIEVVKQNKGENFTFFYDGEYPLIKRLNRKYPEGRIMTKFYKTPDYKTLYAKLTPDFIHLANDDENRAPEFIAALKTSFKTPLWANALGELDREYEQTKNPSVYDRLIDKKIQIIQTDHPVVLLKYLREKGKHH